MRHFVAWANGAIGFDDARRNLLHVAGRVRQAVGRVSSVTTLPGAFAWSCSCPLVVAAFGSPLPRADEYVVLPSGNPVPMEFALDAQESQKTEWQRAGSSASAATGAPPGDLFQDHPFTGMQRASPRKPTRNLENVKSPRDAGVAVSANVIF